MGSQSLVSKGFAVAAVVVLGLLSTTTVSTATTFTIVWENPSPVYPDGFTVTNSTGTLDAADSLLFQYDLSKHDLLAVSKNDFHTCNTSSPIKKFDDGNTTIQHPPGIFWYICGTKNHCGQGQKLALVVAAPPPSGAPSPGPAGNYAVGLRPHATTSVIVAAAVMLVLVLFRKL